MRTSINSITILAIFSFIIATGQVNAQLLINEISAANYDDFTDNNGEYEDWIEVYNAGATDIDLNGYYFSDDLLDPIKYQVNSSVMVPAGGHRIVYASNRNEVVGTNIHTSFKINQKSIEYAVLADPSGSIIDAFWLENANQKNHSWGRDTDGGANWVVFDNPSPGASNSGGFTGYAPRPVLDIASGAHPGGIILSMSNTDPDVTIRYSNNGVAPTATSTIYTGPINVDNTTVIHAKAFSSDPLMLPSFIETNTYLIDEGHILPVISISGPQVTTLLNGNQIEPQGSLEFFGADGQLKDEAHGEFNEHGNDSWAYDQRGIDYITRDQFGYNDQIHHPIFRTKDRPSYKRLIIKAAANDNYPESAPPGGGAHIIDAYIHSISQIGELRLDERSYEPCIMYVNGEYWGVYEVREKVDDFDFTEYYYDQHEGDIQFIKTWGGTWSDLPNFAPIVAPQIEADWDALVNFITTNDMTDPANYDYVKSVFNTGSMIDYFVLNSYVVTTDWLNYNTGWWRGLDPDGDKKKWRYILWDNDASFGQYINFTGIPDTTPEADPCNPQGIGDEGGQGHVPILNALLNNEEFYNDYVSRFVDLSQSTFSCEFMQSHLDSLINTIAPEMTRHCQRWGGSVPDWQSNVQVISDFINDRCAALDAGLVDCYDIDGPYPLTVQVQPPGAGWVELNSLDLMDFPWDGQYFGGLDIEMQANANGINVFSHWEVNNHIFTDNFVDTTFFEFTQQDTITAWFVTETSEVILNTQPADVGEVRMGSTIYPTLPVTIDAPEGVPQDLEAYSTNMFYVFDHWDLNNHSLTPDELSNPSEITVDTTDIITAVFQELPNFIITIDLEGLEGGSVFFNGTEITDFPFTIQLLAGEEYDLLGISDDHFSFSGWLVDGILLIGDLTDPDNSFILDNAGSIVAIFTEDENYEITFMVDPPEVGDIILDGEQIATYPLTKKYYAPDFDRSIEAVPNEYYDLTHWSVINNEILPDDNSEQIFIMLSDNDTLIAHFVREQYGYFLPNAFSPNGDGLNDTYYITGHAIDMEIFSFDIYDRNGQLVFHSNDIEKGWNGSARDGGNYYAEDGVYVYKMKVRSIFDNRTEEVMGSILLMR